MQEDAEALSEAFLSQKLAGGHKFAFKARNPTSTSTLDVVCSHLDGSALISSVGNPKRTAAQFPGGNPEAHFNHLSFLSRKLPWSHFPPAFITKLLGI